MHGRRIRRPGIVAATAMLSLGGVAAVTTTAAAAATVDTSAWYVLLLVGTAVSIWWSATNALGPAPEVRSSSRGGL